MHGVKVHLNGKYIKEQFYAIVTDSSSFKLKITIMDLIKQDNRNNEIPIPLMYAKFLD